MEVNTEYDVDDSVYVYEEIIGNPEPTTLRDYRVVSGGGKKDLKQTFSSGSYTATSGVNADSGSVESSAVLTPTSLSATQRSNIGGSFAWSFLAGSQNYLGGNAFTGQYAGVCEGILSTVQTLSLGRSIYSTQSFQASGYFPLALGYALVDFPGQSGFEKQGAFIASAAYKDGSISGNMGAEVMKIPESVYIDPIAYGSDMTAHGDQIAGIVAGAGCLDGFSAQNQFENFNALFGQGAITGAAGIGEDSFVSLDYIEARTDGHETAAFEVDAKANGDKAAIIGAGSGKFGRNIGFVSDPSSFFLFENFDLQGAISGAAAIGDNNKAEADWIGAITDGERTLAIGEDLKAESDGLAAVGAAAGNFYWDQKLRRTLFRSGSYQDLGVQGAVAGAVAAGKDSKAQADYVGGATNGRRTSAWADDPMAKSDGLAAVGAAAGKFRQNLGQSSAPYGYLNNDIEGAITLAVSGGDDSLASADFVGATTSGRRTSAEGYHLLARGDEFAATGGASGNVKQFSGINLIGPYSYMDTDGAVVADVGLGKDSRASANYISAGTNGLQTYAFGENLKAKGKRSAQALAGAGDGISLANGVLEIDQGSVTGLSAFKNAAVSADRLAARTGLNAESLGSGLQAGGDESALAYSAAGDRLTVWADSVGVDDGSLTGLGAQGKKSTVSAAALSSRQSFLESTSEGYWLTATGKKTVAGSAAGEKIDLYSNRMEAEDGSLTGLAAQGKPGTVSAFGLQSSQTLLASTSTGEYLEALGRQALAASGAGEKIKLQADRAEVEQGSITAITAYENARVSSDLLTSGDLQLTVGPLTLDGVGSMGMGLSGSGEKSVSAASGAGDKVVIKADEDKGKAKVEQGSITGVTAYDNAVASGDLLASGDLQLTVGPLTLDGVGSMGMGLSASGAKSASGASGVGEKVVIKSNEELGRAKVTNGGITGMASHEGAEVDADLLGSAGAAGGAISGWIGINPSATGTKSALGTGFGSEVVVEADAAKVETTFGSIIGLTAYGANARTFAGSIGGDQLLGVPSLSASNVLAEGEMSASAGSGAGLAVKVESDQTYGSVDATVGPIVGSSALGDARITANTLVFNDATPIATGLSAKGKKSFAASAVGASTTLGTDMVTVIGGSLVGLGAKNGEVIADNLGFAGGMPSGSGLKASGTKAVAASAVGASTVLENDKVTVGKGSVVGMVAEGGQVEADSLGFDGLYPSGIGLMATGTKSSAAAATGFSTAIESNKITVDAGRVVGMVAEDGQVGSVEAGSSLGVSSSSVTGTNLDASGSKSLEAAAAGYKVTIQSDSAKIDSITAISGVLVAAGASGNSQVTASSLQVSTDSLTAKGSGLTATGSNNALIGAASSGSLTGGTIVNFLPSSSSADYYGITIPWGAYGGARTSSGTVAATWPDHPLTAKVDGTNYVIGGSSASTSNHDRANLQVTGINPVVFAGRVWKSATDHSPSVATYSGGSAKGIWAYKSAASGSREVVNI